MILTNIGTDIEHLSSRLKQCLSRSSFGKIAAVKKTLLLALLVVIAASCAARSSELVGTQASATAESAISETSVRAHMEFLASDAMNGRGSGTRDEWIAATYVAAQLRRWGLEPMGDNDGYVQTITIERPELGAPPVLSMGDRRYTHGTEINVVAMSASAISGTIAAFESGMPASRGSVVVVPEMTRELSSALSAAALVLARSNGCGAFRSAPGALPRVAPRTVGAPAATSRPSCVALDAATYIAAERLPAGTKVTLEAPVRSVQTANAWNAVGRLTGSDPEQAGQIILLSAHIDHLGNGRTQAAAGSDNIYNGADDDASGSVAVLELARAIAAGPRPARTIIFAWFGSEETGGTGSRYFADKPVVPLDSIVANLQFEMIGRPDVKVPPHTLWLTGYERSNLGPELAKRGARLVQDPHPEQSFFTRSDNIQFARRGVIAHTVSSFGLHKDYHQPSDEIRTIDFGHMTDSIRSMLGPIRWLAGSSFEPEWLPGQQPR
jgi:aminopeptidase YwaD